MSDKPLSEIADWSGLEILVGDVAYSILMPFDAYDNSLWYVVERDNPDAEPIVREAEWVLSGKLVLETTGVKAILAWAEQEIRKAEGKGRSLSLIEQEDARWVAVSDIDRVRIVECEKMPAVPGFFETIAKEVFNLEQANGLTLDHTIFVKRGMYSRSLLRHELRHVSQVEGLGGLESFLKEYMSFLLKDGYENHPFEADARRCENGKNMW